MTTVTSDSAAATLRPGQDATSVDALLRPKSIAIIGASPSPRSPSGPLLQSLRNHGFPGPIHLVSRGRTEVLGEPCVESVDDLPEGVDCALICVPRQVAVETVRACASKHMSAAILFASGFAEQDEAGAEDQAALQRIAQESGLALLGPNCFGLHNFIAGVPFELYGVHSPMAYSDERRVAVISQSGGLGSMLSWALREQFGLEPSILAFTGNEAVVSVEDFMIEAAEDDDTTVLAVAAETLRKPQLFLRAAARARERGKPVVLLHPGASERARQSAKSHTGAIAGDHQVMRTLAASEAVVVVEGFDEWVAVTGLLTTYPRPVEADGIGVITGSGGFCGIALDAGTRLGLEFPPLGPGTLERLADLFGNFGRPDNPLDLTTKAATEPENFARAALAMDADPNIGAILIASLGAPEMNLGFAKAGQPFFKQITKPIVFSLLTDSAVVGRDLPDKLAEQRIPYFRSPETALASLSRLTEYGRLTGTAARRRPRPAQPSALASAGALSESQAKLLLTEYGLKVPKGSLCRDEQAALDAASDIGYPVVIKAQAAWLMHKSDVGAVVVGVGSDEALLDAWRKITANLDAAHPSQSIEGMLVEAMAEPGVEFILGGRRDEAWGPVLLVGLGGVWAEALSDARLLPPDADPADIEYELRQLRGAALLDGFRGSPAIDVGALVSATQHVGDLLQAMPAIREIDINPLTVMSNGAGAVALDALIVFDPGTRSDA